MSTRVVRLVPGLAMADLRHEWILTLCLVIAVAAVVAPLLILQGLKHGTVATLRDRLVQDPVFREVRPTQTREYAPQWLERLGIAARVRTVDPAQYQVRIDAFDYDMTVDAMGQGFSPGNEQRDYWTSAKARENGSQNRPMTSAKYQNGSWWCQGLA